MWGSPFLTDWVKQARMAPGPEGRGLSRRWSTGRRDPFLHRPKPLQHTNLSETRKGRHLRCIFFQDRKSREQESIRDCRPGHPWCVSLDDVWVVTTNQEFCTTRHRQATRLKRADQSCHSQQPRHLDKGHCLVYSSRCVIWANLSQTQLWQKAKRKTAAFPAQSLA